MKIKNEVLESLATTGALNKLWQNTLWRRDFSTDFKQFCNLLEGIVNNYMEVKKILLKEFQDAGKAKAGSNGSVEIPAAHIPEFNAKFNELLSEEIKFKGKKFDYPEELLTDDILTMPEKETLDHLFNFTISDNGKKQ